MEKVKTKTLRHLADEANTKAEILPFLKAHDEVNEITMAMHLDQDFFSDDDMDQVSSDMSNGRPNQAAPEQFSVKTSVPSS